MGTKMKNSTKIRVPKKYQERVREIYQDSDGYWCYLNRGWYWEDWGLHTIHEDTQKRILECIAATKKCDCNYCKGLED